MSAERGTWTMPQAGGSNLSGSLRVRSSHEQPLPLPTESQQLLSEITRVENKLRALESGAEGRSAQRAGVGQNLRVIPRQPAGPGTGRPGTGTGQCAPPTTTGSMAAISEVGPRRTRANAARGAVMRNARASAPATRAATAYKSPLKTRVPRAFSS
jgi:hypothetical protein